jgi:hypothetical protein
MTADESIKIVVEGMFDYNIINNNKKRKLKYTIWLSSLSTLSVPDGGCSGGTPYTLNLINTFLFSIPII